jgi:hypothetical protein
VLSLPQVVSSSHEASQGEEEALEGAKAAALFFEAAAGTPSVCSMWMTIPRVTPN